MCFVCAPPPQTEEQPDCVGAFMTPYYSSPAQRRVLRLKLRPGEPHNRSDNIMIRFLLYVVKVSSPLCSATNTFVITSPCWKPPATKLSFFLQRTDYKVSSVDFLSKAISNHRFLARISPAQCVQPQQ